MESTGIRPKWFSFWKFLVILSTRLSRTLVQKEEWTLLPKRKTIQLEQEPFLKNTENSTQFDNVYVLFVKEILALLSEKWMSRKEFGLQSKWMILYV